ncbi:MAG TPA: HAMP domain-containing sensor histidine kinase [Rhizobiaceae bacterium]|nr:HAMP domain-containing sensor histidine kinase [Rhizobiaceae bacterium]
MSEWLAGLAAGCDRLVHPSVTDSDRAAQGRLLRILLAGPFLLAAAAVQVLAPALGVVATLSAICALLATAWLCIVVVASSGRGGPAAAVVLACCASFVGLIVAGAGGIGSPLALLAPCLFAEAYWVGRSRRAAWAGAAAGFAALILQAVASPLIADPQPVSSGWHWLVPVACLLSFAPRLRDLLGARAPLGEGNAGAALEQSLQAVVLRMATNGEVVDASEKARDLLSLQPELLLASGLLDRIHVADRIVYLSAIADLREGARFRRCEMRLRLPRAADQPLGDNYRSFVIELARETEGGEIVGLLRDNGEMAALRAALADARAVAASSDVAKNRFLAGVSHELRTPLNAIIGFSDMLAHGMCGPLSSSRQEEYVRLIRESGNHLLAVVNAILDVSKIESGTYEIHPESFRFGEAAEMCRSMMALQAETKNIGLTMRMGAGVGEIVADRRSVKQMLINLLSNAIKFTPEGGKVSLSATRLGSRLHFSVADTGIGIAAADLERLGEPFTQVQNDYTRQFEGTGLGLSVVRGLVGLHHGTMTIESAPGEGTTVAISLPIDGPDAVLPSRGEVLSMKSSAKNEEINGTLRKIA